MNIASNRRQMPAPLNWQPAGLPCVHHRGRDRDHARCAARTSFIDGEDVTASRCGWTSNINLGLRVRLVPPKSP
jgi:hypothetical protein